MSSSNSTNLDSLSWSTILEYNQLNAFSISKDDLADTTKTQFDDITTSTYKASAGLLKNLSSTLEKLKTNLQMMNNYAIDGSKARTDKKKETAYAQLRSLSAGIDSITRSYKLSGTTLLTGRDFELSYGNSAPLKMSLDNLASSFNPDDAGQDNIGLQLATADKGASVSISYDYLNTLRNSMVSLSGLDITDSYTVEGDDTHEQLTDGEYQVQVKYNGPKSTVYIQNLDGTEIDSLDCDLSGSGQVDLAFKCGVGLSIEKDSWALSSDDVDKYNYQLYGPVSLYANLTYDSVQQHNLDDGTGVTAASASSAKVTGNPLLPGSTGVMMTTASPSSVAAGRTAMETGKYTAQVRYNGAKSSVWLYDDRGSLISTVRDIDLTKTGDNRSTTVDLGVGVSLTLNPSQDFTSTNRTYITTLDYTAKQDAYEVFDFDAYYDVIANALTMIEENIDTVSKAQDALSSQYSIVQSASKTASSGGAAAKTSLMGVLASGSSGFSASSLFGAVNSTSSSSTPTVLSASASSIMSSLQTSMSSLSDVDPAILALYYR